MEQFNEIQDKLEKAIEKDDTNSTIDKSNSNKPKTIIKPDPTIRERLAEIIHSQKFHIAVVVLVVLDCILVIAELLIDLDVVKLEDKENHDAPKVLHYLSITVLSLFMVEIGVRIFVMRLEFFKHKLEVFDAIVVIVSFILDIVFRNQEGSATGVGLLVVLRLWRVTRILNGIVMSVKAQAQRKIEHEVALREECEKKLTQMMSTIQKLQDILKQNGINVPEN
ncbi:voltage-gated hydrogen channel 1-like [Patella vulgata]|uniref:voltage-gated hydrogen channel 1-like n=1 Tax=Patella vulgata TaxID=6465 RepID=UPI0021807031|nr:voltage-gated hydrogen channel 1-like [Patella vulgata]